MTTAVNFQPNSTKTNETDKKESILPEITLKAVLLGFLLAMVLCASNTYVALKVGRTISGSIPAAVLSILFLSFWKKTSILEHNIVQTTASAGEVVSAGITFTIPALVMIGFWDHFNYFEVLSVAIIGGFLGVAFSVPLRRSMIIQQKLPYPEGIATAAVLKSGDAKGTGKILISGGLFAGLYSFFQDGARWLTSEVQSWKNIGPVPVGGGFELSPVLLGAGYIVGLRVSTAMIIGTGITWVIAVPLYAILYGAPDLDAHVSALAIWKKVKMIGIGGMIVGGLWGMLSLSKVMIEAITSSIDTLKGKTTDMSSLPRVDRDMPMNYVGLMIIVLTIPLLFMFYSSLAAPLDLSTMHGVFVAITATLASLLIAFGCAAVGSYLTGIAGSTLLPISGITISGILLFGGLLFLLFAGQVDLTVNSPHAISVAGATILFASVVALSASLSADNMQDLKAGSIVGATPWKQQFMLLVGVVGGAIVVAPVLDLLFNAYGFGDVVPRQGMDLTQTLKAPQATMMATMAKGLFAGGIDWVMISIGAVIGIVIITIDQYFKRIGKPNTLPVLAVSFGMYMPASMILTFLTGGILAYYTTKKRNTLPKEKQAISEQNGVLYASGVIAGTALMGVLIAIPLSQGIHMDKAMGQLPLMVTECAGVGIFAWLMYIMYKKGSCNTQ
ncbi:MAG: oligopeptide transporter, OPT family [Candidatus Paracaedibacteraceae bacterium]|nr:oligopeptide transporter, OPT family [Candidatus Paracaedibacteraceae bacterium]